MPGNEEKLVEDEIGVLTGSPGAEPQGPAPEPARVPVLALLGLWIVGSLLQAVVLAAQEDLPLHLGLASSIPLFGLLALLAVPLWRFCAWLGEERPPLWRQAVLHGAAGAAGISLWLGTYFGLLYLMAGPVPLREQFTEGGLWIFFQTSITYALVVVGVVAIQTSRRLRRQQARSSQLRLLAREMEVRALRAQLRPHFLFNVLNSIYSLISTRPREAQQMVELVAGLMRSTLELSEEGFITLAEELRLARRYLEIEQIRLGSRLEVDWSLDERADGVLVPPLLLQPLIENSVKHGVAGSVTPRKITVSTAVVGEEVEIRVADDGPGADLAPGEGSGRGLAITRGRLAALYDGRSRLAVANLGPHGFEVRVVLPAETADPAVAIDPGGAPD